MLGFLLLFQAAGKVSGNYGPETYSFTASCADRKCGLDASGPRNAAFLLFLIGFGIKAGIVPLHTWLPAAHPVAPSNVSRSCPRAHQDRIYGMVRVFFYFLAIADVVGVTVLTIGTVQPCSVCCMP